MKTERELSPLPRQCLHFASRTLVKRLGEFLVIATGAYFLARSLARLSGIALWVPEEWRNTVDVLTATLGGSVFVAAQAVLDFYNPGISERARKQDKHIRKQRQIKILLIAVLAILLALVSLAGFMRLRAACVVAFDPRDWLAKQRLQNSFDARDDANKLATNGGTLLPLLENDPGKPETTRSVPNPDQLAHIPEFVDIKRQVVYLPIRYPTHLNEYICHVTKSTGIDGLTYMLANEPDRLFDILEKQGTKQMAETNWMFLILDVLIVVFFSIGLSCSYDVASTLGGVIGGG